MIVMLVNMLLRYKYYLMKTDKNMLIPYIYL